MWNRHRFFVVVFVVAVAIAAGGGAARDAAAGDAVRPKPPNIIVILADDLGWSDLGCYGAARHRTPHLDRLAAEGLRFASAYAAQPICSASRAALITGRTPARLQLTDFLPGRPVMDSQKLLRPQIVAALPLAERSLAELLAPAGLHSACIGKWHLGGAGFGPREQGFDEAFDVPPNAPSSPADDGKAAYALTVRAEQFLEQHRDEPCFLLLSHHAPHIPLAAAPELIASNHAAFNPLYAAVIETLDDSVGRLLAKLDSLGLAENTIVIFTSDNGGLSVVEGVATPATTNAPLRGGKGSLYEGGIRVPLVVRWPAAVKPGQTSHAPMILADLAPTLLELCGLDLPADLDGVSLAAQLQRGAATERRSFCWHYPHYSNQRGEPAGAIRSLDWKLLEFFADDRIELYHLASDPGETQNLAVSEPGRVRDLRRELAAWRVRVGAALPAPNPGYDPSAAWTTVGQQPDGSVRLAASLAEIHGDMLRYEPEERKNTLGYWTRAQDWCRWDFRLDRPGRFDVEILQGCGQGSGGAEIDLTLFRAADSADRQTLSAVVEETGHFQNFAARRVGEANLPAPGRYTLTVRARTKPGPAVMDLREVRLKPRD